MHPSVCNIELPSRKESTESVSIQACWPHQVRTERIPGCRASFHRFTLVEKMMGTIPSSGWISAKMAGFIRQNRRAIPANRGAVPFEVPDSEPDS